MVKKYDVLGLLPAFKNERKLVTWRQNTDKLVKEILKTHDRYFSDYDSIYPLFDTGNIESTCSGLWDFCKYNLKYTIESEAEQTVKSPSAILEPGEKIDCKHYSLFIAGVLDAIKCNEGCDWEWFYRFACYDNTKQIEHVFVVVNTGNTEIWIDPVLSSFNYHKQPNYYEDDTSMALYAISGIKEGDMPKPLDITVDKQRVEASYLTWVKIDFLSLKALMNKNPSITYGPVKQWYIDNGYDFEHLQRFLNS